MVKKQQQPLSNNKKILQEQVGRLNNEIEELRLEREESKKNVLHFMQEVDTTRQELKKAQDLIDELTFSHVDGYHSPPPEQRDEKPKISMLLSRISLLDEHKINKLFQLLDQPEEDLKVQLEDATTELKKTKAENVLLKDELEQLTQEYKATRGALQIENERAEIIERRWKESESHLEQAESTIQCLNKDLEFFRQQEWRTVPDNILPEKLCKLQENYSSVVEKLDLAQSKLDEKVKAANSWQEKYNMLFKQYVQLENKQTELADAAKIRENHLRTINKTLRDEIRKVNKVQEEIINVEYLRNVIIKFLEKRNTRAQLVPILSTLLKCSNEDQARLLKLTTRNRIVSS